MLYRDRLKDLRREKGLQSQMVARAVGLSRDVYSHYENEQYIMPTKHLNNTVNFLEVSFDYAFGFTKTRQYPNSTKDLDWKKAGSRLKELRKELNLTGTELAKICNTVQPVISNYERGVHLISTPILYKISKKYKVSADWLLGKVDEPKYRQPKTKN